MGSMSWSSYAEGAYSAGWVCRNFAQCRSSSRSNGACRWFCRSCQNDFCLKCTHPEGVPSKSFNIGDLVEVEILEGIGQGNWVRGRILSEGSQPGTYTVHILPTTQFDRVGGFADTDVPDIFSEHLRKDWRCARCTFLNDVSNCLCLV